VLGEISLDAGLHAGDRRKTSRLIRCRVILEKKFSIALSQEAEGQARLPCD
jgi:hypothetical protein